MELGYYAVSFPFTGGTHSKAGLPFVTFCSQDQLSFVKLDTGKGGGLLG